METMPFMKIEQFRFSADNLGYLVFNDKTGMAIDGGAPGEILAFAEDRGLTIAYVANTHQHHDHIHGNHALLDKTGAAFIDCATLGSDREIMLDNESVTLIPTPGHTTDSITFLADDFMVTGDTLFNGTVGNCFSGDLEAFYRSLDRLISLPGRTKIYAGHDYVVESMQVAKKIEPDNPDIDAYMETYNPNLVVSTVADELKVNPYIRFNAPEMVRHIEKNNMPAGTPLERFKALMELY